MWGSKTTITASPPKTKQIGNPGGQAQTGPSVAAQMVKNNRGNARQQHQPRQPRAPRGRAPKVTSPKYSALDSQYGTQKAFNKGVEQNARSQYQPELTQLEKEEQGEQGLHAQRQSDNVNIYKQYSDQANAAFAQAKSAMAEIAARQNSSTSAGQAALQAALSNTGVAGLSGVGNQDEFMKEAAGLGNAGSQQLAGMQSGLTGEMSKNLSAPGVGLGEATGTEQARSNAQLAKIGNERQKVLANVPNIIAKTRGEMSKQEQEREANKLQNRIASQKLGLEKGTVKKEGNLKNRELQNKEREGREATNLKIQELAQAGGLEAKKLEAEREKLHNEAQKAKTAEQKAAAELAGKRFDHGLEIMAGYLKENPKAEYRPGDPNATALAAEGKQEYRRDAMHLYQILTQQGNLTAPEAFRLMASSGNGYIEQFAHTHEAIYNRAQHPVTRIVTNKRGGQQEQRIGKPPTQRGGNRPPKIAKK